MTFQSGLFDDKRRQRVRTRSFYLPESLDNRVGVVVRCEAQPDPEARQSDKLVVRLENGGEEVEVYRWQVDELDPPPGL